jgi:hypothetical protein
LRSGGEIIEMMNEGRAKMVGGGGRWAANLTSTRARFSTTEIRDRSITENGIAQIEREREREREREKRERGKKKVFVDAMEGWKAEWQRKKE